MYIHAVLHNPLSGLFDADQDDLVGLTDLEHTIAAGREVSDVQNQTTHRCIYIFIRTQTLMNNGPSYAEGPLYGGVWGLKSIGFEGPRAIWS